MPKVRSRDGVELNYSVHDYTDPWKKPNTLVLQHGFSRSSRFWYNMIPYLSRWYRVVCPDLRGLGQSSNDFDLNTGISLENYLSDIVTIATDVGADTFHYAGESFGGTLGLALAAEYVDRVRTVSVFSSALFIADVTKNTTFAFGHPTWQEALKTLGSKGWAIESKKGGKTRFPPENDPGHQEWYTNEMGKSDVDVLIAMSKAASVVDVTNHLDRVRAPVLGLYPIGYDTSVMRAKLSNVKVVTLPTMYHHIQATEPAVCAKNVLYFMSHNDGVTCEE